MQHSAYGTQKPLTLSCQPTQPESSEGVPQQPHDDRAHHAAALLLREGVGVCARLNPAA